MRFLFTITGPWGTGAATVVDGVAQELLKMGHEVKIIFPDLGLPSPESDKYYGNTDLYRIIEFPRSYDGVEFPTFPLIITDPNPRNVQGAWTYKDLTDDELRAFIAMLKTEFGHVIDEFKPDVIETEHIWLMGYVLSEMNVPYIVGSHNSDQMGFRYDRRMRSYAIACAQRASYIWALSEAGKTEIESLYGVPADKVIFMPNGYDQHMFAPRELDRADVLKQHNIDADPSLPIITFVGKISKTKGFDTLLQSNALLQHTTPCTILVFGSGAIEDVYVSPPSAEKMHNVVLMGHRAPDEIAACHNIASLSVLPSREEGFGVAALEAMGCALPIVATRTGHMAKFAVGCLITPDDPPALATAIGRILDMPIDERRQLGMRAREAALAYSWNTITSRRLNYYRRMSEASM